MRQVCLFIGEGDSERYFFPKILETKEFVSLNQKQGIISIYQKEDIFWFFPFPPNLGNHISGKERLKKPETYRLASLYAKNCAYLFGEQYEIHLVVIFDTDGASSEDRKKNIMEAINKSGVDFKKIIIKPVFVEIESWYLAGLEEDFPFFIQNKKSEITKFISSETSMEHCKEKFNDLIDLDKLIGATDISQAVAENFNEEKAIKYSKSYKDFNNELRRNGFF